MKIGIYDPYLDDLGGGEKYMMTIAQCLSQDNSVDIFWDDRDDVKKVEERFNLDLSKTTVTSNIFAQSTGFMKRFSESKKYDAILILSDGSIPLLQSKKIFLHVQQPLVEFQSVSLKDKIKLKRITKIFCNSEFTRSFISKRFGLNVSVIYPPVDLRPQDIKKEDIILHVGRFRTKNVPGTQDYKKQKVMVETFKDMVDKGFTKWKFVIAAGVQEENIEEFNKMREEVKDYPIVFYVNETNKKLWDLYNRAKIYWHASGYGEDLDSHPEYAEHFGISTVEAMGAGAVPIVINAGGQKEIVQEGESGFLWNTLNELKEKTLLLAGDEKLFQTMSKNAKKRANYFAGGRFCEQVKELIKK